MDGLGNPLYFQLTGGNVHDSTVAIDVLSHLDISDSTILADKAYGTNEILNYIQKQDGDYAIPPKSNTRNPWRCDWVLYKERHLVECFFLCLYRCYRHFVEIDHLPRLFRIALDIFMQTVYPKYKKYNVTFLLLTTLYSFKI